MTLVLEPGALIGGKYRLERLLGRGGMGEVWAAEQSLTRQRVAMKFLLAAGKSSATDTENATTRKRFLREARAACAVVHPNVVQVLDVIEVDGGTPAMIMELLQGESLEARLARDGKLTPEETVAIILRVVSAVGTAHAHGVVHRDLKPDNIFLVETAEGTDVKVVDFGIAKFAPKDGAAQTAALTATNAMLGTPHYMSPEQAFGEKQIDHRADIWSLGIVMYRCLSGQLPTAAENLGQILKIIMTRSIPKLAVAAPDVPPELARMVDAMMSYAPDDRPSDLREVKQALERMHALGVADFGPPASDTLAATTGPVLPASAASLTTPDAIAQPPARRVPPAAYALGGALLIAGITTVVLVMNRRQTSPEPEAAARATAATSASAEAIASSSHADPAHTTPPAIESVTSGVVTTSPTAPTPLSVTRAGVTGRPPSTASSVAPATPTTPSATSSLGGIVTKPPF